MAPPPEEAKGWGYPDHDSTFVQRDRDNEWILRGPAPFGRGLIWWSGAASNFEEAEAAAREEGADAVLWGKAWYHTDGIVVQPYVAVADATDLWTVTLSPTGGQGVTLSVGLPRRRFELAPVVLDREVVQRLRSPSALVIYASKESDRTIGRVGRRLRALEWEADGWTRVESDGVQGWLHLPDLSERSELVDFASGVIGLLRTDWVRATEMLDLVAKNDHAPQRIRVDAHLMLALAASRLGRMGKAEEHINAARDLSPHDAAVTRYEVMWRLDRLARTGDPSEERSALLGVLEQRAYQFDEGDPWFAAAVMAVAGGGGG